MEQGHISSAKHLQLKPNDLAIAQFYGLPKVLAPTSPLSPIAASRDIPMFDMAYWMMKKLKHLVKDSPTTVNAPGEFLERLKGVTITGLVDVESMLSSITQSGH